MASTTPRSAPAEKVCAVCKKADVDLNLCKPCVGIYYCGKTCQTKDWRTHKILCKAYADSPRPVPASPEQEYRRIIVFDPLAANRTPKIVWVDSKKEWILDHLYRTNPLNARGVGIHGRNRPCTARFNPIIPAGQSYDHHLQCLTPWHIPSVPGVNPAYIHQTIRATLDSSRLPIHYHFPDDLIYIMSRWEGKDMWGEVLIPGGPKLQDMTMADFSCAVHWLSDFGIDNANLPGPSLTPEWRGLDLIFLQRLSQSAFNSVMIADGYTVAAAVAMNERNAEKLRRAHAEPELPTREATVLPGGTTIISFEPGDTIHLH